MNWGLKARVFISCGQQKGAGEVEVAHKIREKVEKMGFEPYIAVEEQTLKGVKENIFRKLSESEYFIFIDFRREKLEDDKYRGSLFSHQELAVATFLDDIEVLAFQEKGVKEDDGILKFIQANCIQFQDRHLLPDVIAEKIREQEWDPDWRNELLLERDHKDYGDAIDARVNKGSRWYHVKVKNLHWQKMAHDCVAYLESIKDILKGDVKLFELVEFKWKGVNSSRIVIPPKLFRYLDAFHIYHDSPTIVHMGINPFIVDFTGYYQLYTLKGSGDFELTYVVFSENFSPVRATFKLHIGNHLDDIEFCTKG